MTFDVGRQFDIRPFDLPLRPISPPIYDSVTVPKWYSTAIDQSDGSNVTRLSKVWFALAALASKSHMSMYAAGFLMSATGISLDYISDGYDIKRNAGEPDDAFRQRVQNLISIWESAGTAPDIRGAVAYLLDMDQSEIAVLEQAVTYPRANFSVRLLGNPGEVVAWSAVDTLIQQIRAAGVLYVSPPYVISPEWVAGTGGYGFGGYGENYGDD